MCKRLYEKECKLHYPYPCTAEIAPGQKLLGEMQNMVKEFTNFVLQVLLFFNICNHSEKLFINFFVYTFEHSTFIYKIYDVIPFNMWL
ncbi:unnamed protein product [Camellia sinensis]